jgi:hypothetical protein
MRPVLVTIILLLGCGDSPSGPGDDAGIGGDGGDPTADGGLPSARTVTLTLNNRPTNAAAFSFLVAYQDGASAWTLAPAPAGDVYSLPIYAPTYGVAFACMNTSAAASPQVRSVTAAHFAVGERTTVTLDVPARCSDRSVPTVQLSGSIVNRGLGGGFHAVQWGTRAVVANGAGNFTLAVPPGTHDLVVTHGYPLGNGDYYIDEAHVTRNVTINAATTRLIDFAAAQDVQRFYVDVDPSGNVRNALSTILYTANGTQIGLVRETDNSDTASLAAAQMLASDVYDQSITVFNAGRSATITNATNAPGDQTWVAPAPLGAATTQLVTKDPYVILQTSWAAYAGVAGYTWNGTQQRDAVDCGGNGGCTIAWSAYASPGVTGAMPAYVMPDLSKLAGWKPGFAFTGAVPIVGTVTAFTSTAGPSDFPPGIPTNGTRRAFVRSDYAITP